MYDGAIRQKREPQKKIDLPKYSHPKRQKRYNTLRQKKSRDPLTESSGEEVCSVTSLSRCFRASTKDEGRLPAASPLSTAPLKSDGSISGEKY